MKDKTKRKRNNQTSKRWKTPQNSTDSRRGVATVFSSFKSFCRSIKFTKKSDEEFGWGMKTLFFFFFFNCNNFLLYLETFIQIKFVEAGYLNFFWVASNVLYEECSSYGMSYLSNDTFKPSFQSNYLLRQGNVGST